MNEIQQVAFRFFGPITVTYLLAALMLIATARLFPFQKNVGKVDITSRPILDVVLGMVACLAILAVGNYLRIDKIWKPDMEPWSGLWWILTNVEIYSPIFIVIAIRKQALETIYVSGNGLPIKVFGGLFTSIICVIVFLSLRSELSRFPEVLANSMKWSSIKNFPAVFMEGVAVAFLFVRLRWWLGTLWALLIPSMLFAASHIPGALHAGESLTAISEFFVLNTSIMTVVLYSCSKTRDVIFLGMVHYMMDVAIRSF